MLNIHIHDQYLPRKCEIEYGVQRTVFLGLQKDTTAKFVYTFPDEREETLVIEYGISSICQTKENAIVQQVISLMEISLRN